MAADCSFPRFHTRKKERDQDGAKDPPPVGRQRRRFAAHGAGNGRGRELWLGPQSLRSHANRGWKDWYLYRRWRLAICSLYAPLANPRLAVVVIAQGTDARRHFPAAVAGEIYRGLNHRFGTAINLQVATTLDDEEKEVADAEEAAEQTADSIAGETPETSSATPTVTPSPATTTPELKTGNARTTQPGQTRAHAPGKEARGAEDHTTNDAGQ